MIGSFRSLNLGASFEILRLRMALVFRLDQEVAYVSLYLRLKQWSILDF
jgi:hypothetical protein